MRRRLYCICITTALVFGMSGCGSQIPDMTEEERAAISEYAVELLLKYDTNQDSRLVDLELLEEEPKPTATPTPIPTESPVQDSSDEDDVPVTESEKVVVPGGDMNATLGLDSDIAFSYEKYQLVSEYADIVNKELVLVAEAGKQFLVCDFVLVNDGAEKQTVDMLLENIKYTFLIDEEVIGAQVTMLSNDLATYMGILDANESCKVVLLAEDKEEKLTSAEAIYLQVQRGEEIATIQIK